MSEEPTDSNETTAAPQAEPSQPQPRGITRITVQGFKSLRDETSIEIRPLTILAGANSSGKSSIMQPLLLMKQTLEAPYDPGPLKLDGPNVWFNSGEQLFSINGTESDRIPTFSLSVEKDDGSIFSTSFEQLEGRDLEITLTKLEDPVSGSSIEVRPDLTDNEAKVLAKAMSLYVSASWPYDEVKWRVGRDKCFLSLRLYVVENGSVNAVRTLGSPGYIFRSDILATIHVPGLRGNPRRSYLAAGYERNADEYQELTDGGKIADGPFMFPGIFDQYVAKILLNMLEKRELFRHYCYEELESAMGSLGLANTVQPIRVNDAEIELRVNRTMDWTDSVNIADVGFGVSQVLPVVVALLVAEPGQLVYIEQPELHLHPKAQAAMATLLADTAKRGVRVVVETHSDTLLLAVQTLVAEDKLNADDVILHWFERDDEGVTRVTSGDLSRAGTYGDWPEDFSKIRAQLEDSYLDASSERAWEEIPEPSTNGKHANGHRAGTSTKAAAKA